MISSFYSQSCPLKTQRHYPHCHTPKSSHSRLNIFQSINHFSLNIVIDHFSCCNSDLQDSPQGSSPRLSQHANGKDSCSIMSQWPNQTLDDQKQPHVLSSIAEEEHHLEKQRNGLQHGFDSQLSDILENVNGEKQGKLASNHFLWGLPKDNFYSFYFDLF